MKLALEQEDISAIASAVTKQLLPLLTASHDPIANPIMDVAELAAYLRVKPTWVYKQVEYKAIPFFRVGRYPRFRRKEIEAWFEKQSIPDAAPPHPKLKAVQ